MYVFHFGNEKNIVYVAKALSKTIDIYDEEYYVTIEDDKIPRDSGYLDCVWVPKEEGAVNGKRFFWLEERDIKKADKIIDHFYKTKWFEAKEIFEKRQANILKKIKAKRRFIE